MKQQIFLLNEEVIGLIELGLLNYLSEKFMDFIELVSLAIAVSLNTAMSREKSLA